MKINNKKQMDDVSGNESVFMAIDKGETRIRVIGDIHAVKEHANIQVDGKYKMIACPTENARMLVEAGESQITDIPPCPLCERGYPVKTAYLAVAVNRETFKAGILKKGPTVLGKVQALKDDTDWGNEGDYDIKIIRTGEDLATKYEVIGVPVTKSKPLTDVESTHLDKLAETVSLDKMTTPRTYAEIVKIIGEDYPDFKVVEKASSEARNF